MQEAEDWLQQQENGQFPENSNYKMNTKNLKDTFFPIFPFG